MQTSGCSHVSARFKGRTRPFVLQSFGGSAIHHEAGPFRFGRNLQPPGERGRQRAWLRLEKTAALLQPANLPSSRSWSPGYEQEASGGIIKENQTRVQKAAEKASLRLRKGHIHRPGHMCATLATQPKKQNKLHSGHVGQSSTKTTCLCPQCATSRCRSLSFRKTTGFGTCLFHSFSLETISPKTASETYRPCSENCTNPSP